MRLKMWLMAGLLLAGSLASAQTKFYVATTGDDTRSAATAQNPATPWKTPQHAHDAATLGSFITEVHVAQGDYSAGTTGTPLSCQGNNAALCITRNGTSAAFPFRFICDSKYSVPSAAGSGCRIRSASAGTGIGNIANNIDIVGFDYGSNGNAIIGILNGCYPANASCPTGNNVNITDNYIHDIAQTGNDGGPGGTGCPSEGAILVNQHHGSNQTGVQVLRNRVTNYGNQALKGATGINQCHGIYVDASGAKVQSNVVEDIVAYGIHYYSAPCNAMITNNTVNRVGQSAIIIAGGDCSPGGNSTISNNITNFALHYGIQLGTGGGTPPCSAASPIALINNLGSNNGLGNVGQANSCTPVSGGVSEAPTSTFANYLGTANDDLHLKATSIAVSGGSTSCVASQSNCTPTVDNDGLAMSTPRPIGAFTAGGAPPPPVPHFVPPVPALTSCGLDNIGVPINCPSLTLQNSGTGTLTFTSRTPSGDFTTVANGSCGPLPISVAAGGSCTFIPVFTPTSVGIRPGTITLVSNDPSSPAVLQITGTGTQPQGLVSVTGSTILFDNFNTGALDSTKWVLDTGSSPGTGSGNVSQFATANLDMSKGMLGMQLTQTANVTTKIYDSLDQVPSGDLVSNCNTQAIWCGVHDTGTPGTAVPTTSLVTSPAVNGFARQFTCAFTGNGGCRFSTFLNPGAPDTTSTGFTYDVWVNVPIPASLNQLELDSNQGIASNSLVIVGTQCNFVEGLVDYTKNLTSTTSQWVPSGIPCTRAQFTAGMHHIIAAGHHDVSGNVTYDSWTFDGVTTAFGVGAVTSLFNVPWGNGFKSVNFQFNGNGSGTATVYASLLSNIETVAGSNIASLGTEVRSVSTLGFGTYSCTMRASSTALAPGAAGVVTPGNISSCFSFINNSQTENDFPEIEGQFPKQIEWTNWICATPGPSCNQGTTTNVVFSPDQSQHQYKTVWAPGLITYFIDGVQVSSHNQNIPTTPAFILFNHWGTNSVSFGGTATVGVPRWMYVSNFSFTPAATLNFGVQNLSVTSGTQSLTFQNVGTGALTMGAVTITGDFAIPPGGNHCPVAPSTLAPSGSCTVLVNFTPIAPGTRPGQVTFNSNDPLSPQVATLTGIGQQTISPPTGIVFTQGVIGAH